jgi:hypothetical protein
MKDSDDTEGQALRGSWATPDTEQPPSDGQGHGFRFQSMPDTDQVRSEVAGSEGLMHGRSAVGDADDDVEGHIRRPGGE